MREALPSVASCVEAPNGVAVAADEAAARAMLAEAQIGEQRFRDAFGREPARYLIFSFDDPALGSKAREAGRALGFGAVLPLPSAALMERLRAEALARMPSAGKAPAKAVRVDAHPSGEPRGRNTVPHELGHQWYTAAFWSDAVTARRYGSPGPDWLDEAAAMLMEDEEGVRRYHQRFADGRNGDAAKAAAIPPEMPLADLTSMTHPSMAAMAARPTPTAAQGPVMIVHGARPSLFYEQARLFTDYLIERSGDRRILAAVSDGLRDGSTLDTWLVENGAKHRLPASLAAMQADWDIWLDQRFGPAKTQDARAAATAAFSAS